MRLTPPTAHLAPTPHFAPAAHLASAARGWLGAALLAASLASPQLAAAALPPDASGTWAITETRGGQKCTATLMLQPTRLALSAEDLDRGAARYQGVCVDSADGSWLVQEGPDAARLVWRLEYEKSTVFFAFDVAEAADGALGGNGDVYAAPRADPKAIKRVGNFDARRVSKAYDLRDPIVARRVSGTAL